MGSEAYRGGLAQALGKLNFLGSFQTDYRKHMVRANGRVGSYFWLLKKKAAEGVNLDELDPAFHPFDLDKIKQLRRDLFARPGLHTSRSRLRDPFSSGFCTIECNFRLEVDAFGMPTVAEGVIFDVTERHEPEPANPYSDLTAIAGHLKEARRLADRNAMEFLGRDIKRVFDTAGQIAINRVLE